MRNTSDDSGNALRKGARTMRRVVAIFNGFIHDFAAAAWLAFIVVIALLHETHLKHPQAACQFNQIERQFFWGSVIAMSVVIVTGAGRTFTYVENWYGKEAEGVRRKMLIVKHVGLFAAFAAGYLWIFAKVFDT